MFLFNIVKNRLQAHEGTGVLNSPFHELFYGKNNFLIQKQKGDDHHAYG